VPEHRQAAPRTIKHGAAAEVAVAVVDQHDVMVAAGVGEGQDVADGGRDVVVRALHDPARTTADLVPRARLQAAAPERLVEDVVVAARSKLALQQRDARREVQS